MSRKSGLFRRKEGIGETLGSGPVHHRPMSGALTHRKKETSKQNHHMSRPNQRPTPTASYQILHSVRQMG